MGRKSKMAAKQKIPENGKGSSVKISFWPATVKLLCATQTAFDHGEGEGEAGACSIRTTVAESVHSPREIENGKFKTQIAFLDGKDPVPFEKAFKDIFRMGSFQKDFVRAGDGAKTRLELTVVEPTIPLSSPSKTVLVPKSRDGHSSLTALVVKIHDVHSEHKPIMPVIYLFCRDVARNNHGVLCISPDEEDRKRPRTRFVFNEVIPLPVKDLNNDTLEISLLHDLGEEITDEVTGSLLGETIIEVRDILSGFYMEDVPFYVDNDEVYIVTISAKIIYFPH